MKKTTLALIVTTTFISSAAFADTSLVSNNSSGFYAGGDIGYNTVILNEVTPADNNTGGFAFGGHVGYMFNPYFGAETGYTKFATFHSASVSNTNYSLEALDVAAKGVYPFNPQWSLFGKLGLAYMHAKAQGYSYQTQNDIITINSGPVAHGGGGPVIGLGTAYNITPNLTVNAGWTFMMGNTNIYLFSDQVGNANLFYTGLDYHF